MTVILIVLLIVLLVGGGGVYYGPRAGWVGPQYGIGLVGLLVIVLLILLLTGNLHVPLR